MSLCMNPSHEHAPLVALTDEEAAQTMISEGGPSYRSATGQGHAPPVSHDVAGRLRQQAEAQFYAHPLKSMLIAFSVGVVIGAAARRAG